jgi:hypothetical protein
VKCSSARLPVAGTTAQTQQPFLCYHSSVIIRSCGSKRHALVCCDFPAGGQELFDPPTVTC